jgi:hypothetical protein
VVEQLKVLCKECKWASVIDPETRFALGQENKEMLNALLNSRYRLSEFLYCSKNGWLESAISKKECEDWDWVEE